MYQKNDKFISSEDANRILNQNLWESMFKSESTLPYIQQNGLTKQIDSVVPVAGLISEISSDLLFGERPTISTGDESIDLMLKDEIFSQRFWSGILEASAYVSALGTMFAYMFVQDGITYIKYIASNTCLWKRDYVTGKLTNFIIFDKVESKNDWTYYQIQEHSIEYDGGIAGYYLYNYTIAVDKMGVVQDIQSIPSLEGVVKIGGIDTLPIVQIDNIGLLNSKIGKSDYKGKERMIADIDNRINQINFVLDEHAEPWIGLPAGVLTEDGKLNRQQGKMFAKSGASDEEISIAAWNPQMEASFTSIKMLLEIVLFTSRISSPISGYGMATGVDTQSGKALKWKSISTLAMVNRKRIYWEDAFISMLTTLALINPKYSSIDSKKITISWPDGLPTSMDEMIDSVIKSLEADLISKQKARELLYDYDEDMSKDEQAMIDSEDKPIEDKPMI